MNFLNACKMNKNEEKNILTSLIPHIQQQRIETELI